MIAGGNAARAGHVLDNDVGIAGDMFAEMVGKDASVKIIAAARTGAEQERHGLAFVEIGGALLGLGRTCDQRDDECGGGKSLQENRHQRSSLEFFLPEGSHNDPSHSSVAVRRAANSSIAAGGYGPSRAAAEQRPCVHGGGTKSQCVSAIT